MIGDAEHPLPEWGPAAYEHLAGPTARDPIMAALAARHGIIHFIPDTDSYSRLVRAIVSQQISGRAAQTIYGRLCLLTGAVPLPERIAELPDDAMRGCGLSRNKQLAIRDLTTRVIDGRLDIARLPFLPDADVVAQLVTVRGVGRWSAEMLLLFGLGRPDVLPVDDLGVRAGIGRAYGLSALPTFAQTRDIAGPWRPYASAAAYYLWRSLETQSP